MEISENEKSEISELKKEIKVKSEIVEETKKKTNEILKRLESEKKKISGVKEYIEKGIKETIESSTQEVKMKEEAENVKKAALKNVEKMKKDELSQIKNLNKPSRNHYLIIKLLYLIFNPEEKIPGDNIQLELPNMKKKCLNLTPDQIKKKMIERIDNLSWLTPEFLNKVKMYTELPYTDPHFMEQLSVGCKDIVDYFQNLVNYKRLYDKVDPFMKNLQQGARAIQKKEELEKKLQALLETQKKIQKEFDESKAKLGNEEIELNTLLEKLARAEKQ